MSGFAGRPLISSKPTPLGSVCLGHDHPPPQKRRSAPQQQGPFSRADLSSMTLQCSGNQEATSQLVVLKQTCAKTTACFLQENRLLRASWTWVHFQLLKLLNGQIVAWPRNLQWFLHEIYVRTSSKKSAIVEWLCCSHLGKPKTEAPIASADILEDAVQDLVAQVGHADVNVITSVSNKTTIVTQTISAGRSLRSPTFGSFVHACLEQPYEVEQAELVPRHNGVSKWESQVYQIYNNLFVAYVCFVTLHCM